MNESSDAQGGEREAPQHPSIKVQTRTTESVDVLDVQGDIVTSSEDEITRAVDQLIESGATRAILNLSQASYINSGGIAAIIEILVKFKGAGCTVAITGLSDYFQRIFRMLGLGELAPIVATEEDAIAALYPTDANA